MTVAPKILVVPTCRPGDMKNFFEKWKAHADWDIAIVVEDAYEPTEQDWKPAGAGWEIVHIAHKQIATMFGEAASIFSHRNSAIRCAGFVLAKEFGAEVVVTLDDDCRPHPRGYDAYGFCAAHSDQLTIDRWCTTVPRVHVRGVPYRNRGTAPVHVNVGLWTDVFDLDAIQQLSGQRSQPHLTMHPGTAPLARGIYFPMCGMNLAFRIEALPLMYFPPMGRGQPYDRFEDIWCGLVAKRVADQLGWHMRVGRPTIQHNRQSNPFVNLMKEAPGIAANERMWEGIDRIELTATDAASCMVQMARSFADSSIEYLRSWGRNIFIWLELI